MRVAVIHLDLGIGGAEQLVLNVCTGLLNQSKNASVSSTSKSKKKNAKNKVNNEAVIDVDIYTSHHDLSHCFTETKDGGLLNPRIIVAGDWLPRHIFGKGTALCASVRMLYLALFIILIHLYNTFIFKRSDDKFPYVPYSYKKVDRKNSSSKNTTGKANSGSTKFYDVVFADGVSTMVPFFNLAGLPTVFYCHFPDKYLCTERESLLKQIYRWPLDFIESITTRSASKVLVNSSFTQSIYRRAFLSHVKREVQLPLVLYPPVNLATLVPPPVKVPLNGHILSLNRFERKKNIRLAIEAYNYYLNEVDQINIHNEKVIAQRDSKRNQLMPANVRKGTSEQEFFPKVPLKIAGGYDKNNKENVEHLSELKALVNELNISSKGGDVQFCPSVSDAERAKLLTNASTLLYTPDQEHFGIVPLEAMYAGCPVIAVASGGPLETILHGETGYLVENTPEAFGQAITDILIFKNSAERQDMSKRANSHVEENFSFEKFQKSLHKIVKITAEEGTRDFFLNFSPTGMTAEAVQARDQQKVSVMKALLKLIQKKYFEIFMVSVSIFSAWYYCKKNKYFKDDEDEEVFVN